MDAAKSLAWEALPNWWLKTGSSIFPDVALVFQALLAMPGGAASLERDFSIASNVLTVHRAQLDQAYVEMTMLLHMSMDKIPPFPQIMELSSTDAHAALPRRLRNKGNFVKFLELDKEASEGGGRRRTTWWRRMMHRRRTRRSSRLTMVVLMVKLLTTELMMMVVGRRL